MPGRRFGIAGAAVLLALGLAGCPDDGGATAGGDTAAGPETGADGTSDPARDPGRDAPAADLGVDTPADPGKDPGPQDPGGKDTGRPDAGTDPSYTDPGPHDTPPADVPVADLPVADIPGVHCWGTDPAFPEFDKGCGYDGDCTLVFHTVNCCGTQVAWGIRWNQQGAFQAAEALCDSQYPACGCAQGPTTAEDGESAFGTGSFGVRCVDGTCRSHATPGCDGVEVTVATQVARADACTHNDGCRMMELGPVCDSLSCRQVAVSVSAPEDALATLQQAGMDGLGLGCGGYHCGCGPLGAPVCLDGHCRLCPSDCSGSCEGLRTAARELAESSRTCYGPGECVVPDVCTTCGTAVRAGAPEAGLRQLGEAIAQACGPCDGWCRLGPQPYEAVCDSGTCQRLSPVGGECAAVKARFDALVAAPASLDCLSDDDCVPSTYGSTPFCTDACGCAVVTNRTAAPWARVLADEYGLLECPAESCPCKKCMSVARCVAGRCQ